jgi:hypothetical protein
MTQGFDIPMNLFCQFTGRGHDQGTNALRIVRDRIQVRSKYAGKAAKKKADRNGDKHSGFADIEFAHACAQGASVETKDFRGAVFTAYFPLDLFQHALDMFTFHIFKGLCRLY